MTKCSQVKALVRRGIPQHLRGITWQMLSGAHLCQEKAAYIQYLATDSACEKVTHPGKGVHKARMSYSCERLVFQGFYDVMDDIIKFDQ